MWYNWITYIIFNLDKFYKLKLCSLHFISIDILVNLINDCSRQLPKLGFSFFHLKTARDVIELDLDSNTAPTEVKFTKIVTAVWAPSQDNGPQNKTEQNKTKQNK